MLYFSQTNFWALAQPITTCNCLQGPSYLCTNNHNQSSSLDMREVVTIQHKDFCHEFYNFNILKYILDYLSL